MKIIFFDAKEYDKKYFDKENNGRHEITYIEENLTLENVDKAKGFDAVCGFVNTKGNAEILTKLKENGVKVWLQRSMGYNEIDLAKANELGIHVFRVPNYSAESVAEHAVALLMTVNRHFIKTYKRTSTANFTLNGLEGNQIFGSVVGVIGSGKIGQAFIKIMKGFGANIIVYDEFAQKNFPDTATKLGFKWVTKDELLSQSDFISLHAPLLPSTFHMIDSDAIAKMKDGVILVNAARGALVDIKALVQGLKSGKIARVGLDVLEDEDDKFFFDRSSDLEKIKAENKEWKHLLEANNVLITSHQAFFTKTALTQIATITLDNADKAEKGDFSTELILQEDGKVLNG